MNNTDILKVIKGLDELSELKISLNIKTSYNLAKIKISLTPFANLIQQKQQELYQKWGEKNSEDGTIIVLKENIPMLNADLNELYNIENEIQLTKLKLSDFGEVSIPFEIIEKLLPIIIED